MKQILNNCPLILFFLLFCGFTAGAQEQFEEELTQERKAAKNFKQQQRYLINNSAFIDPETGLVTENARELLYQQSLEASAQSPKKGALSGPVPNINWQSRGPGNRSGFTTALAFDPNDPLGKKAWAGGETGGLWYNNDVSDPNSPWQNVDDFWASLRITEIAFNQSDPQKIYVATAGGIYKSTDAGQSWTKLAANVTAPAGTPNYFGGIKDMIVVGETEIYAGTTRGVIKSVDGGLNWSRILLPQALSGYTTVGPPFSSTASGATTIVTSLKRHNASGYLFAAFGCGEVFLSTNGGQSWSSFYAAPMLNRTHTLVGISQGNFATAQAVYVISTIDGNAAANHFVKTTDNGVTWSSLNWPGLSNFQLWRSFMFEVHPLNPNVFWAGSLGLVYSINGGQSVQSTIATTPVGQADYHEIVFSQADPNIALIGNDQGVCYWTGVTGSPAGASRFNGYNVYQAYNVAMSSTAGSDLLLAVAQDQPGIRMSAPGFNNAVSLPSSEGYFIQIDENEPDIAFFSVFGGVSVSCVYNTATQQMVKQIQNFGNGYSDAPRIYNSASNTLLAFKSFDQTVPGRVYFDVLNNVSTVNSPGTNVFSTMYVDGIFAADGSAVTGLYDHTRAMAFGHDPNTVFLFAYGGGGAKGQGLLFKITQFFSGSPLVQRINIGQVFGNDCHSIAVGQHDDEILVAIDLITTGETLWYTNNGGQNWIGLKKPNGANVTNSGLPGNYSALCAIFNPLDYKQVFLGGWDGVWSCNDISDPNLQWGFTGAGLGHVETRDIQIRASDGRIAVATFGRGIFTAELLPQTGPVAAFSANNVSGCVPFTVQFNSNSTGTISGLAWQFPGGVPSSSTAANPLVTYNTPGVYDVELTVSGPGGNSTAMQSQYIQAGAYPTSDFTFTVNGSTVDFVSNAVAANGIVWDFGDQTGSSMTNPSHVYASDGTYIVSLQAANNCGQAVHTETITISTAPTANFSAAPVQGCTPLTVQYSNSSSANATGFLWSFPGGTPSSSTAANPLVVYNTPGTYDAELTVSNAAGSDTRLQSGVVQVFAQAVPGFTMSVNGATVDFTNTSLNCTGYLWDFGDGTVGSNAASPSHNYASDGTYTVTLIGGNSCASYPVTQTLVIVTSPTAGFYLSQTTGCAPYTKTFNNTSSANATSFLWQFPGGTPSSSTAQYPTVTYNAAGVYDVILTASNAAGSDTEAKTAYINIQSSPVASFTAVPNGLSVDFDNTSIGASGFTWSFGDGTPAVQTTQTGIINHVYSAPGTYLVVLVASHPVCTGATLVQTINVSTVNTEDQSADELRVKVFPNPTDDQITLEMENAPQGNWNIMFYNQLGQVLLETAAELNHERFSKTIDVSALPDGLYCLQMLSATRHLSVQIVVKH